MARRSICTDPNKLAARQASNRAAAAGRIPLPNKLPCTDCGHVWSPGERRHEYDHYKGYARENWLDVEAVCSLCHASRDSAKKAQTHCYRGHELSLGNTYIKPNGTRQCVECRRLYDRQTRTRPPTYRKYRADYMRSRRLLIKQRGTDV